MLNDNTKEMISLDVEGNQITMPQDRKMEIQNDLQIKSSFHIFLSKGKSHILGC